MLPSSMEVTTGRASQSARPERDAANFLPAVLPGMRGEAETHVTGDGFDLLWQRRRSQPSAPIRQIELQQRAFARVRQMPCPPAVERIRRRPILIDVPIDHGAETEPNLFYSPAPSKKFHCRRIGLLSQQLDIDQ